MLREPPTERMVRGVVEVLVAVEDILVVKAEDVFTWAVRIQRQSYILILLGKGQARGSVTGPTGVNVCIGVYILGRSQGRN